MTTRKQSKTGLAAHVLVLTLAERSALLQVLECPFNGDADDLKAVVGADLAAAARSMRRKVLDWMDATRVPGSAP